MSLHQEIKVAYCVAYDWHMLPQSLASIYSNADKILVSIDKANRTWKGNPFDLDHNSLKDLIYRIDPENKVDIWFGDFFDPSKSPMENEVAQRNAMADRLGEGGWHVQLDVDEYFVDFAAFTQYLRKLPRNLLLRDKPVTVWVKWLPIIKKTPKGYLLGNTAGIDTETIAIATNKPRYRYGRYTEGKQLQWKTNFWLLHESLSRTKEGLLQKFSNWGHATDIANIESFVELWNVLDEHNYKFIKDYHILHPNAVPSLRYQACTSIEELINSLESKDNEINYYKKNIKKALKYSLDI